MKRSKQNDSFSKQTTIVVGLLLLFFLPLVVWLLIIQTVGGFELAEPLTYAAFVFADALTIALSIVWIKKHRNTRIGFALPLGLVLVPFFFYFLMGACRAIFNIMSCPAGWEIMAVFVATFHSFPFFIHFPLHF